VDLSWSVQNVANTEIFCNKMNQPAILIVIQGLQTVGEKDYTPNQSLSHLMFGPRLFWKRTQ